MIESCCKSHRINLTSQNLGWKLKLRTYKTTFARFARDVFLMRKRRPTRSILREAVDDPKKHRQISVHFFNLLCFIFSFRQGSKHPGKPNSTLIQPGMNMSKLLIAIMIDYDKNMRPFYGGEAFSKPSGRFLSLDFEIRRTIFLSSWMLVKSQCCPSQKFFNFSEQVIGTRCTLTRRETTRRAL